MISSTSRLQSLLCVNLNGPLNQHMTDQAQTSLHVATAHKIQRAKRKPAAQALASAFSLPRLLNFSSEVWKRPWPNLEDVSINLSLISSSAVREVCATRDRRRVMHRFLVPGTAPYGIRQDCQQLLHSPKIPSTLYSFPQYCPPDFHRCTATKP